MKTGSTIVSSVAGIGGARDSAASISRREVWARRLPLLPAFIADAAYTGQFGLNNAGREVTVGSLPITATGDVGIGNPFIGGGGPRGIQLSAVFKF